MCVWGVSYYSTAIRIYAVSASKYARMQTHYVFILARWLECVCVCVWGAKIVEGGDGHKRPVSLRAIISILSLAYAVCMFVPFRLDSSFFHLLQL